MIDVPETKSEPRLEKESIRRPLHIGLLRFSTAQFLAALVLLFVSAPIIAAMKDGRVVESVLLTLVLVSGVLAVGSRRKNLWTAGILVTPALIGKWLNHIYPDAIPQKFFLFFGLLFVVFVAFKLLIFVLKAPQVNGEVLCAGISNYLLLGLLWSFAYMLIAQLVPLSFAFNGTPVDGSTIKPIDAFYFSFVTLSTVGYGDITPVSPTARALAVMEAMTGTIFITVLIARLVALYSGQKSDQN